MSVAIRAEHVSKEYRLGAINHGMLYKDIQSALARRFGRPDPHAKLGMERHTDGSDRFWALKDFTYDIEQGERVGLIGRNGAGKSTLLKILSRITAPTEGSIKLRGRVTSLLEVGTGFHPELSGRDNVFLNGAILGMKRSEVAKKFDEIVAFSEIEKFIDTPVKRYSSGMYVRLAFAVAAHLDSEILLADEVLAVGDAAFQKKCLGMMENVSKEQGRTVVFVSHNMGAVRQLCSRGVFLDKGRILFLGDIQEAVRCYLSDVEANEATFQDGPLESAKIEQDNAELVVTARYDLGMHLDVPCLGVKLHDPYGNALFSINPRNYDLLRDSGLELDGTIKIRITEPKLHDGSYNVSLYFGDSKRDYVVHENCMRIDVKDMVVLRRPANIATYGPVHPDCQYSFR
jgi:lipopolysaccharide transport system ATP-binding protein